MGFHIVRMMGLAAAVVLPTGLTMPSFADEDDGWFWGRGKMGHWFRDEMMGRHMMDGMGHGIMMSRKYSEQRLGALKKEFGITEAQGKAWDDYAAAIKASSASMRDMHVKMMGVNEPATLPERVNLHQEMMTTRVGAMKAVDVATLALYEALDAAQKKKADELILGMGMM